MKNFSLVLFVLSLLAFCTAGLHCIFLLSFPFGLFRPIIACDTKILELGTVNSDTDVDCRFVITNRGNRPLYVRDIVSACGSGNELKIVSFSLEPILPRQQRDLVIRFHPYSLRENILKKAVIYSNDPQSSHYILSIKATINYIPPPLSPDPVLAPIAQ